MGGKNSTALSRCFNYSDSNFLIIDNFVGEEIFYFILCYSSFFPSISAYIIFSYFSYKSSPYGSESLPPSDISSSEFF